MTVIEMATIVKEFALLSLARFVWCWQPTGSPITVPTCPPDHASGPIPEGFLSYAFEWSSFPDYSGNNSVGRNELSYTLISNIGDIQGAKPYIRVGGNTLDYSWYNATLDTAIIGIFNDTLSPNYPTTVTIGPSYYDGYNQWPGVKFVNDFNQAHQGPTGLRNLLSTIGPACKALSNGNLQYWEFGNEADIYPTTNVPARPKSYTVEEYVAEWVNGTRTIKAKMMEECPDLVTDEAFKFIGPSFAGPDVFDAVAAVKAGLDVDDLLAEWSMHAYMGGNNAPGNTLRGTLMNHTHVREVMDKLANVSRGLHAEKDLPFAITEVNSLSGFGQYNISDVFGAALWTLDWNLYGASTGDVQRIHMQQGTNARYQSWQPFDTDKATKGTKVPYYGDVAVATALGKSGEHRTQVAAIELPDGNAETDIAYGIYEDGALVRMAIINFEPYNHTSTADRPVKTWQFNLGKCSGQATTQRLWAPGSDAKEDVTFDGYSYEYELDGGKAVTVDNVETGETIDVEGGSIKVDVPASSAVIVNLCCSK